MPNVITYNALISACKKENHPEMALELYEAMIRQVVTPDVITFGVLGGACEDSSQPEQAMELFKTM